MNDLARYSPWPARLLGIDKWEQRRKTPEEVTREYDHDKWGAILERVKRGGMTATLDEVDEWELGSLPETLCAAGEELEILKPAEAHLRYLDLVEETLGKYLPAATLVELGAGYGSIVLSLAKRAAFSGTAILAGEYTKSGAELIGTLARREGLKVVSGRCDFNTEPLTDFSIPEGAVIYTSYSICYVPTLKNEHIERLLRCKPSIVVHFEPCHEHYDRETLMGLMRRRYVEVNDYNTNLVSMLHCQQERNTIRIVEERPHVFGSNPLLPASVVVWTPGRT